MSVIRGTSPYWTAPVLRTTARAGESGVTVSAWMVARTVVWGRSGL
ncbi:hypothetical protein OIA45_46370 (plasmid) [Streptomyces chartreusis]|nr:hypothetical protein OIA45_46370 [Streptomyces chartreusis]